MSRWYFDPQEITKSYLNHDWLEGDSKRKKYNMQLGFHYFSRISCIFFEITSNVLNSMDRNQFSGNMFYYSSWLPQGNPLAMQLIELAWQNWWRQPWSEWITHCHINRKMQHGLAAQNEVLLGSCEKPCNSTTLIIKGKNVNISKYYFKEGFCKIHVICSGGSSMPLLASVTKPHAWEVVTSCLKSRARTLDALNSKPRNKSCGLSVFCLL